MSALAPADRERLVKLLGMLGSDHVGERAAAGAAANKLVKQRGSQWADVVVPSCPATQQEAPRQHPPTDAIDDLYFIRCRLWHCTEWEQSFIRSISVRGRFSAKQQAIIEQIAASLRKRGLS